MAKPNKAELKKQGAELKDIVAQGRKKTLNFALLLGKDQMYLKTHMKKNSSMLRKEAKKDGGGPKGVEGTFSASGKNLIFTVDEEAPGNFDKLTKKYFMERGVPVSVEFRLSESAESAAPAAKDEEPPAEDAAEDEAQEASAKEEQIEEMNKAAEDAGVDTSSAQPSEPDATEDSDAADETRRASLKRFKALTDKLRAVMKTASAEVQKDLKGYVSAFGENMKKDDFSKADNVLNDLEKHLGDADTPAPDAAKNKRKSTIEAMKKGLQSMMADLK